jgi:hypothetical protein
MSQVQSMTRLKMINVENVRQVVLINEQIDERQLTLKKVPS